MTQEIDIAKVQTDRATQSRAAMDNDTIAEYTEAWKNGEKFPPISVYWDGEFFWCDDGHHRTISAKLAGKTTINADVKDGTRRDAILASAGANARHGLKRSNADKRRAALILLNDEDWSKWSDRAIAEMVGVSNRFVSNIRNELSVQRSQMELPDQTRTVTRNGKTYEMKVPAKQDKEQGIDTALLLALYSWNDAVGAALPAHLASKARTAVKIAEDLTMLVRAGYAATTQSISESGEGVKTAVVVTQSGCDLLKKPFPQKIPQPTPEAAPAPHPAKEVFKIGEHMLYKGELVRIAYPARAGENVQIGFLDADGYATAKLEWVKPSELKTVAFATTLKVGDFAMSPIGAKVQIVSINGRMVEADGKNGRRTYFIDKLQPAPQEDEPTATPQTLVPANQKGEVCPDCGADLYAAGASAMIGGISYCEDCGKKRHPAMQKSAENVETVTAEPGGATDEQPIEVVLGWLMGYDMSGETAPGMETLFGAARRWIDDLEEKFINDKEPVGV